VNLVVSLERSRRERLYGDAWEERLRVPDHAATQNPAYHLIVRRSLPVPPGRYTARVRVRDLTSELEGVAEAGIVLPDFSRQPISLSDLQLGTTDSLGAFQLVPTRVYGFNADRLAARITVVDRRPGEWPRRYPIHWRIRDEQAGEIAEGDTILTAGGSGEPIVVRAPGAGLFLGGYVLEVELAEGATRWRSQRSFEVEESGPPRGREYDQLLEALSYIADSREVDGMRNLPPERQSEAWAEFWRRRDPTPETERNEAELEFFRRIRHATQHFQGFGPGWRSDMGRIYIRHGPPDQVEQRPASTQSPPLEIWFYNQPYRRFVFADREGFGRFSLVEPLE
jgi:GWxTD domain-containing protein